MTRKLFLIAAVAVLAVGAMSWLVWDRTHPGGVRSGQAFGSGGAVGTIGMTTIRKGDDVYYLTPFVTNYSDSEVTLLAVTPAALPPGLEFLDAKVYKKADFTSGIPLSWGGALAGDALNPKNVPSMAVRGYKLAPGQQLEDVIYIHLRVTTDQRPLEVSGVVMEYELKGRKFKQVLDHVLRLENPAPNAK